ncbi:MAG: hypothetical protein C3F15_13870 [Holophagae bacterium]|nr:MAG: hypothetical protein C3F15_13870 [Holophagae bacterium]
MRIRTTTLSLFLASAALSRGAVAAQQATTPQGDEHRPPRPPIDCVLDADGDELISSSEIAAAATALATLDRNGDGRLTSDECLPPRPDRGGPQAAPGANRPAPPQDGPGGGGPTRPAPPILTALDQSADGVIDAGEIATAATLLLTLDRDGDGQLTPDEYRPPRPEQETMGRSGSR